MIFPKFIKKFLKKIFCKKVLYLEEIGIDSYPRNHFGGPDNFKQIFSVLKNNKIARKTGVDPRDCWDLDTSFFEWLYCNCKQLLKDTNADLTWKKYEHNKKIYTEGEYIEYLIDLCKRVLLFDEFKNCPEIVWKEVNLDKNSFHSIKCDNTKEEIELFNNQLSKNTKEKTALEREIFDVFYELLHALWW